MPRPDPLDALRLLRRLELEATRHAFADKLRAESRAADTLAKSTHRLTEEAVGAAASDYAAWLPAARSRMQQAAAIHAATVTALDAAKDSVAAASRAERLVLQEAARRGRDRRSARIHKADRLLDDLRARPVKLPPA